MKIFIIITEDKHTDVDVTPHYEKDAAIAAAKEWLGSIIEEVAENNYEEDGEQELNEGMIGDGWVWLFNYGESCIRVVERELK